MHHEQFDTTFPDGETAGDYLQHCAPDRVAGLSLAQIEAAAYMPPVARSAYFAAIAGYAPAPVVVDTLHVTTANAAVPTLPDPIPELVAAAAVSSAATQATLEAAQVTTPQFAMPPAEPVAFVAPPAAIPAAVQPVEVKPMTWGASPVMTATNLVIRLAGEPGATLATVLAHPELIAFAESRRHTPESVLERLAKDGVIVAESASGPAPSTDPPEIESPFRAEVAERSDDAILGPSDWAWVLPDGSQHRVTRSCCRFAVLAGGGVQDVCRTRAEADQRADVLAAANPALIDWAIIQAQPASEVDPPSLETALLVPVEDDSATLAGLLAATEPPALVNIGTAADGAPYMIPPAVDVPPAIQAMAAAAVAAIPPADVAVPELTPAEAWAAFMAEVGETMIAEGAGPNRFEIDSMDRLGWLGRKYAALDTEESELAASYARCLLSIKRRRGAFDRQFGDQARTFTRAELDRQGGRSKTLQTLGGSWAFRATADRLERFDDAAALDWARLNLPSAITVKPAVESVAVAAVSAHWENTGEIPNGFDMVLAGETFGWKPAKGGAE